MLPAASQFDPAQFFAELQKVNDKSAADIAKAKNDMKEEFKAEMEAVKKEAQDQINEVKQAANSQIDAMKEKLASFRATADQSAEDRQQLHGKSGDYNHLFKELIPDSYDGKDPAAFREWAENSSNWLSRLEEAFGIDVLEEMAKRKHDITDEDLEKMCRDKGWKDDAVKKYSAASKLLGSMAKRMRMVVEKHAAMIDK